MKSHRTLAAITGLLLSCQTLGPPQPAEPDSRLDSLGWNLRRAHGKPARVVLLTIDGVRARDVFDDTERARLPEATAPTPARERLPNLARMIDRGVALGGLGQGGTLTATGPNFVSLPGYTELLTGEGAPCQNNDCDERPRRTLADAFAESGAAPREIAVISSWSALHRVAVGDRPRAVVSAGRELGDNLEILADHPDVEHALELGRTAGPCPGHGDYRPDQETSALALAYLRSERPRFAFVSLGDTDEHAHANDYQGYLGALQRADQLVGEIATLADTWNAEGDPTVVLVTTDHGRAENFRDHGEDAPESSQVWLVAAGAQIPARGRVPLDSDAHLSDITTTIAELGAVRRPTRGHASAVSGAISARQEVRRVADLDDLSRP